MCLTILLKLKRGLMIKKLNAGEIRIIGQSAQSGGEAWHGEVKVFHDKRFMCGARCE